MLPLAVGSFSVRAMNVGIIGAGSLGSALGGRLAARGHAIMFGGGASAADVAARQRAQVGSNAEAAAFGEVVILAVPFAAIDAALADAGPLTGRVLWSCVNALKPDYTGLAIGFDNSAAEEVARRARGARVVAAVPPFAHAIAAQQLTYDRALAPTVFICGDDLGAKTIIGALVRDVGADPVDAGMLETARLAEPAMMLAIRIAYAGVPRDVGLRLLERMASPAWRPIPRQPDHDRGLTELVSSDKVPVIAPSGVTTAAPTGLRDHCLAPERIDAAADGAGRYGRMFELPALVADEALLHRIGAAGGFCDGGDCKDDANVEAGWPFFGQYIAHDLTADRSPLRAHADVAVLRNMRSPRANLEALYGGGPLGSPYLYQREDPAKLLEDDGDLPRNQEGLALIGDPRNDVHVFVSQMQVAFIAAHNRLVDRLREDGAGEQSLFDEARRALTWHYQWVIVAEFLPGLTGSGLVEELLDSGPRYYRPRDEPFIPLEFADAAYRYGHSQVRQLYRIQENGPRRPVFPDLIGFGPIGERRVDWTMLFDLPGRPPAERAKPIDGQLPRSLIELPQAITGAVEEDAYRSLAARDLERGQGTGLPSGESVARLIDAQVLTRDEVGIAAFGWKGETPLWLYILREAAVQQGGERLGDVGSRIVAEVLIGILSADPESYLSLDPAWTPTLPSHSDRFGLRDLLVPA